jgi:hypothetical protein
MCKCFILELVLLGMVRVHHTEVVWVELWASKWALACEEGVACRLGR